MATTLGLYNAALLEVGATLLDTDTDDREERYALDTFVTDQGAYQYCLEKIKPKFAISTVELTGAATAGNITLAFTHTLPVDYLGTIEVYSDPELDQRVDRYILDGTTILADYDVIYLRYINNSVALTAWTWPFTNAVAAYLAEKIAPKFAPDLLESKIAQRQAAFDDAIETDGWKEPSARPATPGTALSQTWRLIYNGALQILGKPKLAANDADHPFRVALDTAVEADAVVGVMEDTSWKFGTSSVKIGHDPDIEPDWGYPFAFDKPTDMQRIVAVCKDEYLRHPLTDYVDEGNRFYCGLQFIYLKYVDSDFVTQPSSWPPYFRRLVMARLAMDAAPEIAAEKYADAVEEYRTRKLAAMGNDVVQQPPQVIADGAWTSSRFVNDMDRYGSRRR